MAISKDVRVDYIMAPVTFNADGSMHLVLSGKISSDDVTNGTTLLSSSVTISAPDLGAIMLSTPQAGMSRLDDLTTAIYAYLVANGLAPSGVIS